MSCLGVKGSAEVGQPPMCSSGDRLGVLLVREGRELPTPHRILQDPVRAY